MRSKRPAAGVTASQQPIQKALLTPVPRGSVYGFMFPFGGTVNYAHPGIVLMSTTGLRDGVQKVGVLALAISHGEQTVSWKNKNVLTVPQAEKAGMGLDTKEQWVCLFEQVTAFFPDNIKVIKSAGSSYLGQASDAFTKSVLDAWDAYRTS